MSRVLGYFFQKKRFFLSFAVSELLRKSCHPFTREARRLPCSIASVTHFAAAYSSPYRTTRVGGRSRTFTGQCYQPFCSGDATSHADAHWTVTKCRPREGWIRTPGLRTARELGPLSPPKRDTPRTISTWPLRRRLLPSDPGCIQRFAPLSGEDFQTGLDPPG